jgi:hypothetical protein
MATGDTNDIVSRIYRWLPRAWFPAGSDAVGSFLLSIITGFAAAFTTVYSNISAAALQVRLATATFMLDLITLDFFGPRLPRLPGEADVTFSARIRREILRERVTREAIDRIVFDTTGNHPLIVELNRVSDIGGLRQGFALGSSRLGSVQLPFQVFVTVALANPNPRPIHAGLRSGWAGLRAGFLSLTVPATFPPPNPAAAVVDAAIESVRAAGITVWRQYL